MVSVIVFFFFTPWSNFFSNNRKNLLLITTFLRAPDYCSWRVFAPVLIGHAYTSSCLLIRNFLSWHCNPKGSTGLLVLLFSLGISEYPVGFIWSAKLSLRVLCEVKLDHFKGACMLQHTTALTVASLSCLAHFHNLPYSCRPWSVSPVQTDQTGHSVTSISNIKVMSGGLRGDPVESIYSLKNRSRKLNKD